MTVVYDDGVLHAELAREAGMVAQELVRLIDGLFRQIKQGNPYHNERYGTSFHLMPFGRGVMIWYRNYRPVVQLLSKLCDHYEPLGYQITHIESDAKRAGGVIEITFPNIS